METSSAKKQCPPGKPGRRGFTLVELLVVIGIIAILAALLLPVLSKAKGRAQAVACLNNTKQLTLAWLLYAGDNNDHCVMNIVKFVMDPSPRPMEFDRLWVNNAMDWTTNSSNTNLNLISNGLLFPYVRGSYAVYKCPADKFLSPAQVGLGWTARTRTYAMNMYVSTFREEPSPNPDMFFKYFKLFQKTGDIPNPANIYVLLDCQPDDFGGPSLIFFPPYIFGDYGWGEMPASFHNGAGVFSFADGHAESHKWVVASTVHTVSYAAYGAIIQPPNPDYEWVAARTTVTNESGTLPGN